MLSIEDNCFIHMSELKSGALLQGGKYRIEKSLGQGGFGITYLAEQTNLGRKVCIKEFFMKEYGERTESANTDADATVLTGVSAVTSAAAEIMGRYQAKFVKEAKTIARLDHPGIVRIHDVFEENGTAYYVMDFIEGENLNDMVKREGALSEERALGYIRQVADALSYVHGHNIMHLDVKPANIIVRKSDDKAILIDFGAAKQYDSDGSQTSTTPIGLSAGYAPIEMTKPGGVQTFSPETDIYSLGATLYYLVTGQNPPDASERIEMLMEGESLAFPANISEKVSKAIENALQSRKKRPQTVAEFIKLLQESENTKRITQRPEFCPNCGQKLSSSAKFCPNCGTKVQLADDETEQSISKNSDDENAPETSTLAVVSSDSIRTSGSGILVSIDIFENMPGGNLLNSDNADDIYFEKGTGTDNGHEWVDLGLSVKWATCNLGAYSPEEHGDSFSWGELDPKYDRSPGWKDYKFYRKSIFGGRKTTCYNSWDGKARLMRDDDAAYHRWGGDWRIPTLSEFKELIQNCEFTASTFNGKKGMRVISNINGNSFFLPFSADKYWSNYIDIAHRDEGRAKAFLINGEITILDRYIALPIRPVCHK